MRTRGVVVGSALCATLGCRPSADLSGPNDTGASASVVSSDVGEPQAEVSETEPLQETIAQAEGTEPEAEPTEADPTEAEPAEVESRPEEPKPKAQPKAKPKPAAAALPKPHYTKVDASCGNDGGVGQKLKGFELSTTSGKRVSSGSLRGRVSVVNFWGTWCKPCLKELPEFDHLVRRYRKQGVALVAIATDEDPVPVDEFVNKRKLAAKVLIGGESYANQYGSPKFPFTFVVDHTGVIRGSYRGYRPECMGKLEADIREQLQKRDE